MLGAFGVRAAYGGHRRDWRATVSQLLLIVFFQFHFHFNVFLCYAANVSVISLRVDPLFKRRGSTKQRVKACYGHSSNCVVNKDRKKTLSTQKVTIFNVHTSPSRLFQGTNYYYLKPFVAPLTQTPPPSVFVVLDRNKIRSE